MSDNVTVTTTGSRIDAVCEVCGDGAEAPNKGLGRAVIAAWRTRHQHPEGGAA